MGRAVVSRTVCAVFFMGAGVMHFVSPEAYVAIVPPYLPWPRGLVAVSGAAEVAGGLGLLLRPTRRAAGVGLVLLLVAVLPANIQMLAHYRHRGVGGFAELLLWLRLPLQTALIWWVWRVSRGYHGRLQGRVPEEEVSLK